jgi:hypothetical protein
MSQVYKPNRVLLDSGAQPLMLGKVACTGLGIRRSELELCPLQIQTSLDGIGDRSHFMTCERLSMQMRRDHATDNSMRFISKVRSKRSPPEALALVVGLSGVVIWPSDLLEGNIYVTTVL